MNKLFIVGLVCLTLMACDSGPQVSEKPVEKNKTVSDKPETVSAHDLEKDKKPQTMPTVQTVKKSKGKTRWTRSGSPIDTKEFDKAITEAEKNLKSKPEDESLKKELSTAFTKRGVALTEARQYASAIGDYRKALKYNAENEEAKKWIKTITGIYKSINREVPKEGEEPPPLEFKEKKN